jgi:hypothetical protein
MVMPVPTPWAERAHGATHIQFMVAPIGHLAESRISCVVRCRLHVACCAHPSRHRPSRKFTDALAEVYAWLKQPDNRDEFLVLYLDDNSDLEKFDKDWQLLDEVGACARVCVRVLAVAGQATRIPAMRCHKYLSGPDAGQGQLTLPQRTEC